MEREEILAINEDRLGAWAKLLADQHATPVAVIAVGHDEANGQIHVVIPTNLPPQDVHRIIREALQLWQPPWRPPGPVHREGA